MEEQKRKSLWDNRQSEARKFFEWKEEFNDHFDRWAGNKGRVKDLKACMRTERKIIRNLSGLVEEDRRKKLYTKLLALRKKKPYNGLEMDLEDFHMKLLDELQRVNLRLPQQKKTEQMIGYGVFMGIGWDPVRRWKNWQRTRTNLKNLAREIKKKDKDARGIVAGPRGVGKTTFSLWIMKDVSKITNTEITEENFVLNLPDMKRVRDEAISPYQVDELLTLLNAKRAMSNENVETEEILSKMRYRNTFGLWCTTELGNLTTGHLRAFDFLVEVFEEGKFKFYNKKMLEQFEKRSGEWQKEDYSWIGHFPKLKDKLWDRYKNEIEPSKDKTRKETRKDIKEKKEEKEKLECNRCGYKWKPRTKNPSVCPKCKSSAWDKEE